jgi:hypothetical protein
VIKQRPSFFSIYQLPPSSYLTEADVDQITQIIQRQKKSIYIYPYDSYILNISDTTYNSFALGSYTYSNSLVEEETIRGLQANPPAMVILAVDNIGAIALDDIPNFTRNPLIAKWLIKNYSLAHAYPKYIVLRYDPHKRPQIINSCQAYQLTIALNAKESFIQKIMNVIKPPLYYLGPTRLPYAPWSDTYLIFSNINSETTLKNLFSVSKNTYCINIQAQNNQLIITRVDSFTRKKENIVFTKKEYLKAFIDL